MKTIYSVLLLVAVTAFANMGFAQTKVADEQLKTNTQTLTGNLNYISNLQPVSYHYNTSLYRGLKLPGGIQYGFNTEDVEKVLPGIVKTKSQLYPAGKNALKSAEIKEVDMQSLIPVLLGAIKEQQQQIEELKAQVQSLRQAHSTAAR